MLIGAACQRVVARLTSHSSSSQSKRGSCTTEAVAGVRSVAKAIGSALSRHCPSGPRMENLYFAPGTTPGTKISHTPLEPSDRIGYARRCQ
jgi:hypothetical protein